MRVRISTAALRSPAFSSACSSSIISPISSLLIGILMNRSIACLRTRQLSSPKAEKISGNASSVSQSVSSRKLCKRTSSSEEFIALVICSILVTLSSPSDNQASSSRRLFSNRSRNAASRILLFWICGLGNLSVNKRLASLISAANSSDQFPCRMPSSMRS